MLFPPDNLIEPEPYEAEAVFITMVGHTGEATVEVEAHSPDGDLWHRFELKKTARVVRKFWKALGVKNPVKLAEGAYQHKDGGVGPYSLKGFLLGHDDTAAGAVFVIRDAVLR